MLSGQNYDCDLDRIQRFDSVRHNIVHGLNFISFDEDGLGNEVDYAEHTCLALSNWMAAKHGCKFDSEVLRKALLRRHQKHVRPTDPGG